MNTKSSFATGWNAVNGHWPTGVVGGEEMHQLTIAEMPSHNHGLGNVWLAGSNVQSGDASEYRFSLGIGFTDFTGENQAHNILPRFTTLAYIMKL